MVTGIITGKVDNKGKKGYIVLWTKSENGKEAYNYKAYSEAELVTLLEKANKSLTNAKAEKGKLVGLQGGLDRFDTKNPNIKPLVILKEIVKVVDGNKQEITLGYKVACGCTIKSIKKEDILKHCQKAIKLGCTPIQNAAYIPETDGKTDYLKILGKDGQTFEKEYIKAAKKSTHNMANKMENIKPEVPKPADDKPKSLNEALKSIYNDDQIKQLKLGKSHNVNYKKYANPKFAAEQMKILRESLEQHIDIVPFAHPEITIEAMEAYSLQSKYKVNIKEFINPKYNKSQIFELASGWLTGIDITKYDDPKLSALEMSKVRIELETKLWAKEIKAKKMKIEEELWAYK